MENESVSFQIVYIPDEHVTGVIISETPYWCTVEFIKHGIKHQEIFDQEDIVFLKEVVVPIQKEVEES